MHIRQALTEQFPDEESASDEGVRAEKKRSNKNSLNDGSDPDSIVISEPGQESKSQNQHSLDLEAQLVKSSSEGAIAAALPLGHMFQSEEHLLSVLGCLVNPEADGVNDVDIPSGDELPSTDDIDGSKSSPPETDDTAAKQF